MQTKDKKAAPPVVADLSVEPTCWSRAVPEINGATFLLKGAIVGLVVLLLASGIWPGLLQMLQGGR